MLYQIVRPFAAFTFQVFFRKIYISHRERIPRDKAVILAANHPTAFIDPIMVACFQKRRIYTFVRGDAFEKPIFNLLLRDFYMIPIYRRKDGLDQVKQNKKSFEESYRIIQQKKVLLIMAEGGTNPSNVLNPIQKAPARVALSCLEVNPGLDIEIIPVGVNYTDRNQFRSETKLVFGTPINPGIYLKDFQENEQKGIRELTEELEDRLQELVVQIPPENEKLLKPLLAITRNQFKPPFFPFVRTNFAPLKAELELCKKIQSISAEQKQELSEKVQAYNQLLEKHAITDFSVSRSTTYNFFNSLFLILTSPLFFLGVILNGLPTVGANKFTRKKIKRKAYISSIIVGLGLGFYFIYALAVIIALGLISPKFLLIALIILTLTGIFALYYYDLISAWKAGRKFKQLSHKVQEEILEAREGCRM